MTVVFRFMASVRAACAEAKNEFPSEVNLELNINDWKDGTAIANKIAAMVIVTINSMRVNPFSFCLFTSLLIKKRLSSHICTTLLPSLTDVPIDALLAICASTGSRLEFYLQRRLGSRTNDKWDSDGFRPIVVGVINRHHTGHWRRG